MRKIYLTVVLLTLSVMLIGCGKIGNRGDGFATVTPSVAVPMIKPTYEPTKKPTANPTKPFEGPVLRWVIPDIAVVTNEQTEAFNALLDELGCEYHVKFQGILFEDYKAELNKVRDYADIASTGCASTADSVAMLRDGWFEALDSYLPDSELYKRLPEKVWDRVRMDNSVYCVPGTAAADPVTYFVFNREFFREEQIRDEVLSLEGVEELLSEIPQRDGFSPLIVGSTIHHLWTLGVRIGPGIVYSQKNGVSALWDSVEVSEVCNLLKRYRDKGYINYDFAAGYKNSRNLPKLEAAYGMIGGSNPYDLEKSMQYAIMITSDWSVLPKEDVAIIKTVPGFVYSITNGGTGILSSSAYKSEAFDLLSRFYTDTRLQKILIAENDTITADNVNDVYDDRFSRTIVYGTRDLFVMDTHARDEIWEASIEFLYCGFYPDYGLDRKTLAQIESLVDCYQFIWALPNCEEMKEDLKSQLIALGVNDVVKTVQRQYDEWKKEQSGE